MTAVQNNALTDQDLKFATDIAYKNRNNNKQNRAFWKEEEQLYVSEILKDDDKINHFNASNWKIVHTFVKNGLG
ncbi:hypothetical protein QNH20_23170 [Neobacillus sp. WH10]|uniref:hypothetical protein n=1 Tax=Neobacillus sp. WH10 TaxID=3047873 RepID=UPI0024C14BF4|nr:hypothetical protein [Neobacillus sp. WH10]WHY76956.1 hypothetical protein QNH20_23170 [Neobacillus sp. WH10]